MRNKLEDLNNILFEQLERLQDDDISDEDFEKELKRTDAVNKVSKTIIDNAALSLKALKDVYEMGGSHKVEVPLLGITND